jgi:hypothetical protein
MQDCLDDLIAEKITPINIKTTNERKKFPSNDIREIDNILATHKTIAIFDKP